jgi:outer membrane lipoprotein LolB
MTLKLTKLEVTLRILLVACSCLILHSCSIISNNDQQPKVLQLKSVEDHEAKIAALTHWTARARISVQTSEDSLSADLIWTQIGAAYNLRLSGPFGSGALTIRGNNTKVILLTSDGQSFLASTPEELMLAQLGWSVPLSQLRYWLVGIPDQSSRDNLVTELTDKVGRYVSFFQFGCEVVYKDYYDDRHPNVPRKLSIGCQDVKSRIVLKKWEIR